jgi:hypothetical protein
MTIARSWVARLLTGSLGVCLAHLGLGLGALGCSDEDGDSGGSGGAVAIHPACDGPGSADAPIETELPKLPGFANVRACTNGDAVNVTFDPLDDAVDYRIYPLPDDNHLTIGDDGRIVVDNAIYRCAGHREALYMLEDIVNPDEGWNDNSAGGTTVLNGAVEGFERAESDAKLGHVFTAPADDRQPVYVVATGDAGLDGGFGCGRPIFLSSRPKTYTTDPAEREALIAGGGRDDGIAFYVPKAGGANTRPVFEGTFGDGDTLRWVPGPEATARGQAETLFEVLAEPAAGTAPLMRVHVMPYCSKPHDELVAGTARFKKVRSEGDHPLTALRWSGLTRDTVLVIEALDRGCPYQGNLSPEHADAFTETFGDTVLEYEAYSTLEDMRKASPTGEVFVNGQYDGGGLPRAIARAFLRVAPNHPKDLDAVFTFPESEDLRPTFQGPTGNVYGQHWTSPTFDFSSYNASHVYFGTMLGEFWVSYNDIAADVNGKIRLTPREKARLSADSYLHVTTEVDIISTGRRYPQIIISDQVAPVQDNLPSGTTLIVQPKDFTPTLLQVQICDHRTWDVNDQCPMLPTLPTDIPVVSPLPGELTGTDNAVKIDIYVSTERIYLMLDDKPYSCTVLPATADDGNVYQPPSGPVTVTWGDVLYHSGVDFETGGGPIQGDSYLFHRTHMHKTSRRHFDNLGFSSGGPRPKWDEKRFPCVRSM